MFVGVHMHNFPEQAPDILRRLRIPLMLVLNNDLTWYMDRYDDGKKLWVIRMYHEDVMSNDPIVWADSGHYLMQEVIAKYGGDPKRFILQLTNELNLGIEHGNRGWEVWDTDDAFQQRLKWLLPAHRRLRGYGGNYRISGPFDSPGHQDVDGRNEVRLYAEAGLYDLIDLFGAHFYAEGPDRGGFDDPERIYFSDRVLTLREQLDALGYENLPILIGETNRKDVEVGDLLGEFERYCERIAPALKPEGGIIWFIWSTGNEGAFGTMELADIMDEAHEAGNVLRFQALIDRHLGNTNLPEVPSPGPEVGPPGPEAEIPENLPRCFTQSGVPIQFATVEAAYNVRVQHGQDVVVAELHEVTDGTVELVVESKDPRYPVVLEPREHADNRLGYRASAIMGFSSKYWPTEKRGPWTAICGDARVEGLGMVDGTNHFHLRVVFDKRVAAPSVPIEPPVGEAPPPPPPAPTDPGTPAPEPTPSPAPPDSTPPPPGYSASSPLHGLKALQVWMDFTWPQIRNFALANGFNAVLLKAIDGADWMEAFDPEEGLGSLAEVRAAKEYFEESGLRFGVWVNPKVNNTLWDEDVTAELANICDFVFLDVEPYAGFWEAWRPAGVAFEWMRRVREKSPNGVFVLQPDPRSNRLAEIRPAEWLSECDGWAPQWYWTDFGMSPEGVLEELPGPLDTYPTVPANASPDEIARFMQGLDSIPNVKGAVLWRLGTATHETAQEFTKHFFQGEDLMTKQQKESLYADLSALWAELEENAKEAAELEAKGKAIINKVKDDLGLRSLES